MDASIPASLRQTDRSRLRRKKDRGRFDRSEVEAVLDEGLVAHVGVVVDGAPVVLPMAYARIDDQLYLHGAAANRLLSAAEGTDICVTITLLDGLVLARSAFHHSMNYRCVVLHGSATAVTDPEEKARASDALVDHVAPGRTGDVRAPTASELRATTVVRLPIEEGSLKVRSGPALDEPEDYELAVWAGVVPLWTVAGPPETDDRVAPATPVPPYAIDYTRSHR